MRNQIQTYFLSDDEAALSQSLRNCSQTFFFVDHDKAGSENFELHVDLTECQSGFAYIWDAGTNDSTIARANWSELVRLKSGDAAMAQFLRSRLTTDELVNGDRVNLLLSGCIAMMGTGTEKQVALKTRVYKAVANIATAEVFSVSPTTRERFGPKQLGSRVGFHAVQWCEHPMNILRHAGTKLLYGLPSAQKAK